MTIETRIIASFGDIAAIVLECKKCRARVTRDPSRVSNVPYTCGQCNATWLPERADEDNITNRLLKAISQYRNGVSDGFVVRLEFSGKGLTRSTFQTSEGQQ